MICSSLVPGPVRNLTFEVIPQSEGSVRISWVAPAVTNGDIVSYEVTYGVLDGGISDQSENVTVRGLPEILRNLSKSLSSNHCLIHSID